MAKAIISNRIFIDNPGVEETKKIIKALTYKLDIDTGSKTFFTTETVKNYKILVRGIISMPQGRTDLIPEGYEIVDKRSSEDYPFPDPIYPLRDEQLEVFEGVNSSCFINALPGWGKTFTALHIARKLKQKTLIVTHTVALRDQWIEEVKTLFNIDAGVIGSGIVDYEDKLITVANIQSLVKHYPALVKEYGTIIIDEAHHSPAKTFVEVLDSFYCKYRIALSGTMIRKDGKHILFKDYFGSVVFQPPQSHTMTPTIRLVKTGLMLKPDVTWAEKISDLASNASYQEFIAGVALQEMSVGHKVLVIADRVEFLKTVSYLIGPDCLTVTGETSLEDRKAAKEAIISGAATSLCGSRQIFSEGISIEPLSCVILAIPMSNDSLLEQIVGRIMRMYKDKLPPLVVDMQFQGWQDKKQNKSRLGLYLRKGWAIEVT